MNIELGQFVFFLSWRESLLAVVVLITLYMLLVIWRMRRLKRAAVQTPLEPVEPTVNPAVGAAAYAANADAGNEPEVDASSEEHLPPLAAPSFSDYALLAAAQRRCEAEMLQMREELDALRGEFAGLRDDLRHEAAQIKASQSVSPLYSDAMQMASAGHPAMKIAERCGISRAEAELVVALVKSQS